MKSASEIDLRILLAIILGLTIGCTKAPPVSPAPHSAHEHVHASHGPHDGQLVELGESEYHAELVHDDLNHRVTIYLLDAAAKNGVAIEAAELQLNLVIDGQPHQYLLAAKPAGEEAAGQSSRFELVDEKLCLALDDPKTTGRLNVTIAGKSYVGQIKGHSHH